MVMAEVKEVLSSMGLDRVQFMPTTTENHHRFSSVWP